MIFDSQWFGSSSGVCFRHYFWLENFEKFMRDKNVFIRIAIILNKCNDLFFAIGRLTMVHCELLIEKSSSYNIDRKTWYGNLHEYLQLWLPQQFRSFLKGPAAGLVAWATYAESMYSRLVSPVWYYLLMYTQGEVHLPVRVLSSAACMACNCCSSTCISLNVL